MSNKTNSTQTAVKLRRSVDSLFGFLTTLHGYSTHTKELCGRGSNSLSKSMISIITMIMDLKQEMVTDINSLYGGGYLNTTYSSIQSKKRLFAKQKQPL